MPAISRVGDALSTGHGCDGVTTIGGSNQTKANTAPVLANDSLVIVVGAPTVSHLIPGGSSCVSHTSTLGSGSSSVFINGIAVGRIGDSADGGAMLAGSGNVFAGG